MNASVWSWEGWFPSESVARDGRDAGVRDRPCDECGLPHTAERRHAVLRRMLPASATEIYEQWPHLWPADTSGNGKAPKLLYRDLVAIGAVKPRVLGGDWTLPMSVRRAA